MKTCKNCGKLYDEKSVEAMKHNWVCEAGEICVSDQVQFLRTDKTKEKLVYLGMHCISVN